MLILYSVFLGMGATGAGAPTFAFSPVGSAIFDRSTAPVGTRPL